MADIRRREDRYRDIAEELIETEPALTGIQMSGVRICYLASSHKKKSKGRTVFGECEKVPEKYRWAIPFDFAVTVFEINAALFTEEQLRALLLHELLHIGVEFTEEGGERYRVVGHDFEDFDAVVERYGHGWHRFRPAATMEVRGVPDGPGEGADAA